MARQNLIECLREFAVEERKRHGLKRQTFLHPVWEADLATEAADEIERLRAVLKDISEEGDVIRDNGEIKKMALSASGHLSCRRMAREAISQSGYGG